MITISCQKLLWWKTTFYHARSATFLSFVEFNLFGAPKAAKPGRCDMFSNFMLACSRIISLLQWMSFLLYIIFYNHVSLKPILFPCSLACSEDVLSHDHNYYTYYVILIVFVCCLLEQTKYIFAWKPLILLFSVRKYNCKSVYPFSSLQTSVDTTLVYL